MSVEPAERRLDWLDALRGIAVLAVVFAHLQWRLLPDVHDVTDHLIRPGAFGVLLFFLVSGYIVPASLERRGSLREFWISRVFRLYPAFGVTIALAAGAAAAGVGEIPARAADEPVTTLLAHATMLHELIGGGNLQHQFWTLSYEMVFYVVVSVLFVAGLHRHSCAIAVTLAAGAALGGGLPARLLAGDSIRAALAAAAAVALVGGLLGICGRRRWQVVLGGVLLAGLVLVLMGCNQRPGSWEGLLILAVMFTGTAVYRAAVGQAPWAQAGFAAGAVLIAAFVGAGLHDELLVVRNDPALPVARTWLAALILAGALFGLALYARRLSIPGWLSWLGRVSYSVYLLHFLVVYLLHDSLWAYRDAPAGPRAAMLAAYLAALLGLSHLCHRLVELPGQRLGRAIIARLPRV
jgi:peptidoglycan/LPS O-acetylase OafA/YrhL